MQMQMFRFTKSREETQTSQASFLLTVRMFEITKNHAKAQNDSSDKSEQPFAEKHTTTGQDLCSHQIDKLPPILRALFGQ